MLVNVTTRYRLSILSENLNDAIFLYRRASNMFDYLQEFTAQDDLDREFVEDYRKMTVENYRSYLVCLDDFISGLIKHVKSGKELQIKLRENDWQYDIYSGRDHELSE